MTADDIIKLFLVDTYGTEGICQYCNSSEDYDRFEHRQGVHADSCPFSMAAKYIESLPKEST